MVRLILALCLIAILGGCQRKKSHPPGPALTGSGPSLGLKAMEIRLSESVTGHQFFVKGRDCKKLEATLWHITADQATPQTHYAFTGLPGSFQGNLWLAVQSGDPFGMKDQKSYSLGESMPSCTKTQTSAAPVVFQGPYSVESNQTQTTSVFQAEREVVVLARCMSRKTGGHSFESGDLEYLKKHAAETKDEIIAVTIRWEP